MKVPYDFQKRAVRVARQRMKQQRVLVTSPPGSGKTIMIAELARQEVARGSRVLILAQRRELLRQTFLHLRGAGVTEQQIGAVYPKSVAPLDASRPIQIASVATLLSREFCPPADVVILDEAHHAVADGHAFLLESYPNASIVGFTATPVRLDGRGLGDVFQHLVTAALPSELINRRLLAKPRPFTTPEEFLPDLRGVRRAMGDYIPAGLEDRLDREHLIGNVVQHYLQKAAGRTALVFAVTIAHSKHLIERFRAAGVAADHLDSTMSLPARDAVVQGLRTGDIKVVSNVGILHEGFDLPRTYAVILARPTLSLALYLQQTGRALRRYSTRRPLILDHARNVIRFGLPEADRIFELTDTIIREPGPAPVVICPNCNALVPAGCLACPECQQELRQPVVVPDERIQSLVELTLKEKQQLEMRLRKFLNERNESDPVWEARVIELWTAYRSAATVQI